jgi:AraC family transcriptional regulator
MLVLRSHPRRAGTLTPGDGDAGMESQRALKPFYGSSLTSRDFGEFVMTERRYPGGCTTPVHAHERPLFCVVLEGAYEEYQSGKKLYCTRATTLFHAAAEEHLERFSPCGGRSLIVELEPAWIDRIREISRGGIHSSAAQENGTLSPIGSRLYREFLTNDPAARLIIEGLLLELTGEFFRAERRSEARRPGWLGRAVEMIRDNFPRRLTLAGIAEEVGVHPVHLAQSFRRFHGCTVGDYLRRVRIDYSCKELVRSDISFIDLATAAGFADRSHFTRTFKREVGMLPSQYRTNARDSTSTNLSNCDP